MENDRVRTMIEEVRRESNAELSSLLVAVIIGVVVGFWAGGTWENSEHKAARQHIYRLIENVNGHVKQFSDKDWREVVPVLEEDMTELMAAAEECDCW